MSPVDIIMFAVMLSLLIAIVRSINAHGGAKECLVEFIGTAKNGGAILLFLLGFPVGLLTVYYAAFAISGFREDAYLREAIFRPSFATMCIILTVFFLNGRLVDAIRGFANWSVRQWNKFGLFRT